MIFFWGERFYGKVYQVPGVCYVGTLFFYIMFFPIFPLRTFIVMEGSWQPVKSQLHYATFHETKYTFRGVQISMSFLSVFMGYLRGILGLLIFVLATTAITLPFEEPKHFGFGTRNQLVFTALAIAFSAMFVLSRWLTRAGPNKREKLLAASQVVEEIGK